MQELKSRITTTGEPYLQPFVLINPEILEDSDDEDVYKVLIAFNNDTYHSETLILRNPIIHNDGTDVTIIDYYYSTLNDCLNRQSTLSALIAGGTTVYVKEVY